MGTLREDLCTFMIMSCSILHAMSSVSDRNCRENRNTFLFNNGSFSFSKIISFMR